MASSGITPSSTVSVLLGNGDGTFQSGVSFPFTGARVYAGVAADFNGDGKADLAVSWSNDGFGSPEILLGADILLANGDGTFQMAGQYGLGGYPLGPPYTPIVGSLTVGDFNLDGNADIAVADNNGMRTFLGNGDGSFLSGPNYVGGVAYSAGIGDFNGDGKADVAVVGDSGLVVLLGDNAKRLVFTTQPVDSIAGTGIPPIVVQSQDANGNVVETGASVTLTSSPPGVTATVATVNGVATFNLVINTAGSYTLTASTTGLTSVTSNSFTITASSPSKLSFSTQPTNGTLGAALAPAVVVQVQDQYGNVATGSSASVNVGSIPTGASATVNAQNGVATFSALALNASGTYVLIASSSGFANVVSNPFTIGTTASKLVFTGPPANTVAGAKMSPVVVQVQDSGGNDVSSSNASITLTSTAAGISATTAAVNGVATFNNLALNTAGSYTLTATSSGLTSATSNSFTISPASASKLAFAAQPANGTVGTAIAAVVVQVQDTYGNTVTTSNAAVALASTPAGVSATVNAVSGVATFSGLTFGTPGSYTLTASSSGLGSATSPSFTVRGSTTVTLTSSANPSTFGQSVTLTATVSPTTAGGSITFRDASTTFGQANLGNGSTTMTLSTLAVGSHLLTAVYSGDTYDFASTSATLTQIVAYSISGKVTLSGAGLSRVTVTLSGSQSGSATTDSSGNYSLGVPNGNFTVTPALAGYAFTPPSQTFSNLSSNQTANFTATFTGTVKVSGQVTASGVGVSGVAIEVIGSQTTSTSTDLLGNYQITLPANGSYTLWPSRVGYGFAGPVMLSNLSTDQVQNFTGISIPALEFLPVTPCRLVDTRVSSFPSGFGPPSMMAGQTRTFTVPSNAACGIPSTAAAYSLNVTVVTKGYLGILIIWPSGQPMPNASTLNSYSTTSTAVANAAIVPAGTNGAINVYATDATDLIIDINGYFLPASNGLEFFPVTPCRFVDTRVSSFPSGFGTPALTAGSTRTFTIPSDAACTIPSIAQAYSLNVTAVPQKTLGFLSIWPTGQPLPNVSTLNVYTVGTVVANAAIVPAGSNGAINAYVTDTTDLVIDINGYFAPGTNGLKLYPMTPCRIADTRVSSFLTNLGPPSMSAGSSRSFPVPQSTCGVPTGAGAYSFNFTAVPHAPQLGIFTTWPTDVAMPNVSTMNSYNGSVVANAAIVPASINGAISVYVTDLSDVLFDINGYFAPLGNCTTRVPMDTNGWRSIDPAHSHGFARSDGV